MSDYGRKTVVFFEIDQPFCSRTYGEAPCTAKVGVTGTRKCFQTPGTCQDEENRDGETLVLRFAQDDDGLPLEYGPVIACLDSISIKPLRLNIAGMDDASAAFGTRETVTVSMRDLKWSDHLVDKYRLERTFVPGQLIASYAIPADTFPTFGSRARVIPGSEIALADFLGYNDPALLPYEKGTFWSRWLARNPYYPAMTCRVRRGYVGDALEDMRVQEYVLEVVEPPNNGRVQISASDFFSRIQSRKAVAPFASIGDLEDPITGSPATFEVGTGIGSLTPELGGYSTITNVVQGYVNIGNKEIVKVTRVGDVFTVVQRGALGTTQADHDAGELVQLVLAFEADLSHDIAYTLITGYSKVEAARIDKPEWDTLAAEVTELFTGYIPEPTPVETLVGELMVQAGFTLWPEVSTGMIRYAPLRSGAVSPSVTDQAWIVDGTLSTKPRPDKRISQVIVYYVKRSPLTPLEETTSYAARLMTPGPGLNPYGVEEVRHIYSRWITTGGQNTAAKCGTRVWAMHRDPPLEATFGQDVLKAGQLEEARYFSLEVAEIQDDVGDVKPTAMTPVSIRRDGDVETVDAMTVRFAEEVEDGTRRIFLDTDEFNVNLRTLHDSQYAVPVGGEVIEFIVQEGTTIGSTSTSLPAIKTGSWPEGVTITLINEGRIEGKGGRGGAGGGSPDINGENGATGGPSIELTYAITIDNDGEIWAGGGGGGGGAGSVNVFNGTQKFGGGGGGAGAGTQAESGGSRGAWYPDNPHDPPFAEPQNGGASTATSPGLGGAGEITNVGGGAPGDVGGAGGNGGGPGLVGDAGAGPSSSWGFLSPIGSAGSGGPRGNYIVGNSLATWLSTGDRRGGVA